MARTLWCERVAHPYIWEQEGSLVYVEHKKQNRLVTREILSGLAKGYKISGTHKGLLKAGMVKDSFRSYAVCVYSAGNAESWCVDPVQLENVYTWRPKTKYDLANYSMRKGDALAFLVPSSSQLLDIFAFPSATLTHTRLDMLSEKPRGYVCVCECHPTNPWIAIGYTRGTVQLWNYSSALATASGAGDGYDGSERASSMGEGSGDVKEANGSLKLLRVLTPPDGFENQECTCISFHPSGLMCVCVFGNSTLAVYDTRPASVVSGNVSAAQARTAPVLKSEPIAFPSAIPLGWRLGPCSFHSVYPVCFCAVTRMQASSNPSILVGFNIMEPAMRVLLTLPLEHPTVTLLHSPSTGKLLLTSQTPSGQEVRALCLSSCLSTHTFAEVPVCAPLPLPPEIYSEGWNKALHAYFVRVKQTVSTTGLRPVQFGLTLYKHKIGSSNKTKYRPETFCSIPLSATRVNAISIAQLASFPDGPFVPMRVSVSSNPSSKIPILVCGHILAPLSKVAECAIVRTHTHTATLVLETPRTLASDLFKPPPIRDPTNLLSPPPSIPTTNPNPNDEARVCPELGDNEVMAGHGVCALVYAAEGEGEGAARPTVRFTSFHDAIHWAGPNGDADGILGILHNKNANPSNASSSTAVFVVDNAIVGQWPSPHFISRICDVAKGHRGGIALTIIEGGLEVVCILRSSIPEVYLHAHASPDLSTLYLQKGERLVEALWQPLPTDLNTSQSSPWLLSSGAMLGMLTTHRAIICDREGQVRAQLDFSRDDAHINALQRTASRGTSILWCGSALLVLREGGAVEYLTPAYTHAHTSIHTIHSDFCEHGVNATATQWGRVCALPSATQRARLVSALPDRLVYMSEGFLYTSRATSVSPFPLLLHRPWVPLEPLLLGLLTASGSLPLCIRENSQNTPLSPRAKHMNQPFGWMPDPADVARDTLVKKLVMLMTWPKAALGTTEGEARPTMQCTHKVIEALHQAGHPSLAALVAGICVCVEDVSGGIHTQRQWLSKEDKFYLAIAVKQFTEAPLDLLGSDPGLQELYLDRESLGGGLPHPASACATSLIHAARTLACLGQYQVAFNLYDIAGDDVSLARQLCGHLPTYKAQQDTAALSDAVMMRNPSLGGILCGVAQSTSGYVNSNVTANSVGGSARRPGLFTHANPNQLPQSAVTTPKLFDAFDVLEREHTQTFVGGPPVAKGLNPLYKQTLEDYMGRLSLEVNEEPVQTFGAMSPTIKSPVRPSSPVGPVEGLSESFGLEKSSWVPGIGSGRNDDKVVAYYRFENVVKFGAKEFVTNGEPPARVNFVDLSKWGGMMELFSEASARVRANPTTCDALIDQGEKGLKPCFDIVFSAEPLAEDGRPVLGLRSVFSRGSACDVGPFHDEPNRSRLTVEMWVRRESEPQTMQTLVSRVTRGGSPVWGIGVDNVGRICVRVGAIIPGPAAPSCELITEGECVCMGVWTHIAVTIDCSHIEYVPNDLKAEVQRASVCLFVNARRVLAGELRLPRVMEDDISLNTLYVGYNLAGWRLTEFRLWCVIRSEIDIADSKDTHLGLAVDKKRIIVRSSALPTVPVASQFASVRGLSSTPALGGPDSTPPSAFMSTGRGGLVLPVPDSGGDRKAKNARIKKLENRRGAGAEATPSFAAFDQSGQLPQISPGASFAAFETDASPAADGGSALQSETGVAFDRESSTSFPAFEGTPFSGSATTFPAFDASATPAPSGESVSFPDFDTSASGESAFHVFDAKAVFDTDATAAEPQENASFPAFDVGTSATTAETVSFAAFDTGASSFGTKETVSAAKAVDSKPISTKSGLASPDRDNKANSPRARKLQNRISNSMPSESKDLAAPIGDQTPPLQVADAAPVVEVPSQRPPVPVAEVRTSVAPLEQDTPVPENPENTAPLDEELPQPSTPVAEASPLAEQDAFLENPEHAGTEDVPPVPPPQRPVVEPPPVPVEPKLETAFVGRLSDVGITILEAARDIRTGLVCGGEGGCAPLAVCMPPPFEETGGVAILHINLAGGIVVNKFKIGADSALCTRVRGDAARIGTAIALCARDRLAVFMLEEKVKLAEERLSAPLVYWKWLNSSSLGVVTSSSVYRWTVVGQVSRPIKMCDRPEVNERTWATRRFTGMGALEGPTGGDRYLAWTTCERHRPEVSVDQELLMSSSLTSVVRLGQSQASCTFPALCAELLTLDLGPCVCVCVYENGAICVRLLRLESLLETSTPVLSEHSVWSIAVTITPNSNPNPPGPGAWVFFNPIDVTFIVVSHGGDVIVVDAATGTEATRAHLGTGTEGGVLAAAHTYVHTDTDTRTRTDTRTHALVVMTREGQLLTLTL